MTKGKRGLGVSGAMLGAGKKAKNEAAESSDEGRKERLSFMAAPDVAERLRNRCWHERETLSAYVERAILRQLRADEKANGGEFPQRGGELPKGRPGK